MLSTLGDVILSWSDARRKRALDLLHETKAKFLPVRSFRRQSRLKSFSNMSATFRQKDAKTCDNFEQWYGVYANQWEAFTHHIFLEPMLHELLRKFLVDIRVALLKQQMDEEYFEKVALEGDEVLDDGENTVLLPNRILTAVVLDVMMKLLERIKLRKEYLNLMKVAIIEGTYKDPFLVLEFLKGQQKKANPKTKDRDTLIMKALTTHGRKETLLSILAQESPHFDEVKMISLQLHALVKQRLHFQKNEAMTKNQTSGRKHLLFMMVAREAAHLRHHYFRKWVIMYHNRKHQREKVKIVLHYWHGSTAQRFFLAWRRLVKRTRKNIARIENQRQQAKAIKIQEDIEHVEHFLWNLDNDLSRKKLEKKDLQTKLRMMQKSIDDRTTITLQRAFQSMITIALLLNSTLHNHLKTRMEQIAEGVDPLALTTVYKSRLESGDVDLAGNMTVGHRISDPPSYHKMPRRRGGVDSRDTMKDSEHSLALRKIVELPADRLLLRWLKYHILRVSGDENHRSIPFDAVASNFSSDLSDGKCLALLLTRLQPSTETIEKLLDPDVDSKVRIDRILEFCMRFPGNAPIYGFTTSHLILDPPDRGFLNAAFLSQLFLTKSRMNVLKGSVIHKLQQLYKKFKVPNAELLEILKMYLRKEEHGISSFVTMKDDRAGHIGLIKSITEAMLKVYHSMTNVTMKQRMAEQVLSKIESNMMRYQFRLFSEKLSMDTAQNTRRKGSVHKMVDIVDLKEKRVLQAFTELHYSSLKRYIERAVFRQNIHHLTMHVDDEINEIKEILTNRVKFLSRLFKSYAVHGDSLSFTAMTFREFNHLCLDCELVQASNRASTTRKKVSMKGKKSGQSPKVTRRSGANNTVLPSSFESKSAQVLHRAHLINIIRTTKMDARENDKKKGGGRVETANVGRLGDITINETGFSEALIRIAVTTQLQIWPIHERVKHLIDHILIPCSRTKSRDYFDSVMSSGPIKGVLKAYKGILDESFTDFASHHYHENEVSMSKDDWIQYLQHFKILGQFPETPKSSAKSGSRSPKKFQSKEKERAVDMVMATTIFMDLTKNHSHDDREGDDYVEDFDRFSIVINEFYEGIVLLAFYQYRNPYDPPHRKVEDLITTFIARPGTAESMRSF
eukprot:g1013.t1